MTIPITIEDYDPFIPEPDDILAVSQGDMLENFNALTQAFMVDHVTLTDTVNGGKHNQAQLLVQSLSPQTRSNQFSIYSKIDVNNGSQMFMRPIGNAPEIQYSGFQLYNIGSSDNFSVLPGNFIIQWGNAPFPVSGQNYALITLPSSCKNIYGFWCTTHANTLTGSYWFPQVLQGNQVKVFWAGPFGVSAPSQFFYVAIGQLGTL